MDLFPRKVLAEQSHRKSLVLRLRSLHRHLRCYGHHLYHIEQHLSLIHILEVAASLKNPITNKFQQYKDTITIYQVRRTVNPKGIWRKYDSDESFHVVLSALTTQQPNVLEESTSSFTPLSSEGDVYKRQNMNPATYLPGRKPPETR